jgi:DnaK suppressor protein
MLKKAECAEFRRVLLAMQSRIRSDVQTLSSEALGAAAGGESKSPTHIAELGSQAWEQDFSLRVMESDQELLEEIKAALKRIHDGSFGLCEACQLEGKTPAKSVIPKRRLQALPYARNCVACERKREEFL